jgi:hypothetical protein
MQYTHGGAHSELYMGTIVDKLPTPMPLLEVSDAQVVSSQQR